jgi:hypothetical protein
LRQAPKLTAVDKGGQESACAGLDKDVRALIERSTAAQGLPFHIRDRAVLARVAALVKAARKKEAAKQAS